MSTDNVKDIVRETYGQAPRRARTGAGSACCDGTEACCDPITSNLNDASQDIGGFIRATEPVTVACCDPSCCT